MVIGHLWKLEDTCFVHRWQIQKKKSPKKCSTGNYQREAMLQDRLLSPVTWFQPQEAGKPGRG